MYRYTRHTPLSTGQKYGAIIKDSDLPAHIIERFLTSGTLIKMELPPLAVLPDNWQERRDILATANIFTIGDLLAADDKKLGRAIQKTPKVIKTWKSEAEQWLNPEPTSNSD